jgi:hypothetical protein
MRMEIIVGFDGDQLKNQPTTNLNDEKKKDRIEICTIRMTKSLSRVVED